MTAFPVAGCSACVHACVRMCVCVGKEVLQFNVYLMIFFF